MKFTITVNKFVCPLAQKQHSIGDFYYWSYGKTHQVTTPKNCVYFCCAHDQSVLAFSKQFSCTTADAYKNQS